jgi:hypothetical protein
MSPEIAGFWGGEFWKSMFLGLPEAALLLPSGLDNRDEEEDRSPLGELDPLAWRDLSMSSLVCHCLPGGTIMGGACICAIGRAEDTEDSEAGKSTNSVATLEGSNGVRHRGHFTANAGCAQSDFRHLWNEALSMAV